MNTRIGSINIKCYEFDKMLLFWSAVLGYVPREQASKDWVVLTDPKKLGPNISLDRAENKREGKRGWIHLDL